MTPEALYLDVAACANAGAVAEAAQLYLIANAYATYDARRRPAAGQADARVATALATLRRRSFEAVADERLGAVNTAMAAAVDPTSPAHAALCRVLRTAGRPSYELTYLGGETMAATDMAGNGDGDAVWGDILSKQCPAAPTP
jgi:hypothetical protein